MVHLVEELEFIVTVGEQLERKDGSVFITSRCDKRLKASAVLEMV